MQKNAEKIDETSAAASTTLANKPKCGVIMPIAEIDGLPSSHWEAVLGIIKEAVAPHDFDAELVSNEDFSGVILKKIIDNIYHNPVVVCDVSGKNPNVMFELGMRLTFDKPTVIIKDDQTGFSFDTGPIEHLIYRRDLRYAETVEFKQRLGLKVKETLAKSQLDPTYSSYLKHFGDFTVPIVTTKPIPQFDYIVEKLTELGDAITNLSQRIPITIPPKTRTAREIMDFRDRAVIHLQRALHELNPDAPTMMNPRCLTKIMRLAVEDMHKLSYSADTLDGITQEMSMICGQWYQDAMRTRGVTG